MSTPSKRAAGGLEALQAEWREKEGAGCDHDDFCCHGVCADALAPHIAAVREAHDFLRDLGASNTAEAEKRDAIYRAEDNRGPESWGFTARACEEGRKLLAAILGEPGGSR